MRVLRLMILWPVLAASATIVSVTSPAVRATEPPTATESAAASTAESATKPPTDSPLATQSAAEPAMDSAAMTPKLSPVSPAVTANPVPPAPIAVAAGPTAPTPTANPVNGPIAAGLAHQIQQDKNAGAAATVVTDASNTPFNGPALSQLISGTAQSVSKTSYTLINGSYDFGVAKVLAGYNTVKATSTAVAGNAKANEWNIGAEVPFGSALTLGVGYAESQVKVNGVDRNETTGYSAVLKYALSKRTAVYAGLAKAEEETAAGVSVEKSNRYFVGLNHTF